MSTRPNSLAHRPPTQGAALALVHEAREMQAEDGKAPRREDWNLFFDHLKCINATFYDQLKVVDQKAAYVFTFLIAMMIWSADVRACFAQALRPEATLHWLLSAALAASLTISAVSAILVVVPRNRAGGSSLYWGAWPLSAAALAAMRLSGDPALIANDYQANACNLAAICRQKYRLVRISYLGLLSAVVIYVVALLTA